MRRPEGESGVDTGECQEGVNLEALEEDEQVAP